MKYSFMTFSCPELTLKEVLALAKRLGYDGVEPRLVSKHKHGIEVELDASGRRAVKSMAKKSGVAFACLATSCCYADPKTSAKSVEDTHKIIDLAADVEAPSIRVFGGKMGEGLSRDEAVDVVAKALGSVAGHAQERGVTVCMETHDDWCNPGHVAAVMRRVNHPAIQVNWDIMHPVQRKHATMDEAFETLKPWIRHLHVHDASDDTTLTPIGKGVIDHRRAIELLFSIGYRGFISGEWIDWSDPYELHLPRELATMKGYEKALRR